MPLYRFGDYSVDTDSVEVVGPDGVREVEPQVFDVLRYLIEQPDRLVTKEELLDNVWGDRFVSESALTTRIKQARRALDDDGRTQWAIKTVHGRGYRFVAPSEAAPKPTTDDAPTGPRPIHDELPDALQADARHMFVGREEELAHARSVVSRPPGETSFGWLWLLGEPGIGKTRLAAEVAGEAQREGHRVLFGRNSEDLRVPYQPFIEVIRSSIARAGEDGRAEAIARIPDELDPLLPWKQLTNGAAPEEQLADDEIKRFRLFEAMASWLVDSAGSSPLTMVIDDVHWAADSTLQLLAHLQQRTQAAEVTFVLTARDTAPDINRKVLDLLAAGQASQTATVVRLGGLSDEDARRFVGQTVSLDEVMRQTAGNPLLLQAVDQEDGSVDIEHAVHRRLANLDEAVKETLQISSILGLEFTLDIAAEATGRDELDLLTDLEHAIAARLLDDVGIDRFRFTHALIRSSLRDELSSARRARMHKRIADAIDALSDGHTQLHALAFHTAEAAGADARLRPVAIERLDRSAKQAMEQLSFEEAAATFERAYELADPEDVTNRARLALERGIALTRAGNSVPAATAFEIAIAQSRASGDPTLRIEAALRYEDASWRPGLAGHDALAHLDEAATILDEAVADGEIVDDEAELRSRLVMGRIRALAMTGQTDRADQEFHNEYRTVRALGSPALEAGVLNVYLSQVQFLRGVDEETATLVKRIGELRPNLPEGDTSLHAIHVEGLFATLIGNFDEARRLAMLRRDMFEQTRSSFWTFIQRNQDAMEAFYQGDLAKAEEHAEACLDLANSLPGEDGSGIYGLRMFMIRREQDRLATMAPLVRHVLSQSEASSVWAPGLAMLLVETGDIAEATQVFSEIKQASFDLPLDAIWSTVMIFMIETSVQLGDPASSAVLLDKFARLAGTNVTTGSGLHCFGRAERYLGMLSLDLGDLAAAEDFLGTALEADSAGGSPLWANESRLWLSRVRRAQGHATEADAMLQVVASEAAAAGHLRLERLALEGLQTR